MKRLFTLFLILVTIGLHAAERPKYIFYFIGDGMGHNTIALTEGWLASKAGDECGFQALNFTLFPSVGFATTHCATRRVTDSAAAGTALASGDKTSVGTIGMDTDHSEIQNSVAIDAKNAGMRSGAITSVSIDHATPASFFAHQKSRSMYYEIGHDAPVSGLDLYGGAGFLNPEPDAKPSLWPVLEKAGYTLIRGDQPITCEKAVIMDVEGHTADALDLAIDADQNSFTLAAMTRRSIDFLEKGDTGKGFFLMVEGGQIDWAGHSNDAATLVHETLDFANAIEVALEFYRAQPDQTLIVVTADHETGGVALGRGNLGYDTYFGLLSAQKCSGTVLSRLLKNAGGWDQAKKILEEKMSFGSQVELTDAEWKRLQTKFTEKPSSCSSEAIRLMSVKAGVGWTTGAHTAAYVPVFAIGAGSENFNGRMDNTDIPNRIRALIEGL